MNLVVGATAVSVDLRSGRLGQVNYRREIDRHRGRGTKYWD